jgi:hypothetical protein
MPSWDGSYLGKYNINIIQSETRTHIGCYWKLTLLLDWNGEEKEETFYCLAKRFRSYFHNILDETKKTVNLYKLGTHTIQIAKTTYLLIRPASIKTEFENPLTGEKVSMDIVYEDITLNQFPPDMLTQTLASQIEDIFAYRYIMGIGCNFEKNIHLRYSSVGGYYAVSFAEASVKFSTRRETLPSTVYSKWLLNIKRISNVDGYTNINKLKDVLSRMFKISQKSQDNLNSIPKSLSEFRSQLESIITRLDKEQIWISSFILDRILSQIA